MNAKTTHLALIRSFFTLVAGILLLCSGALRAQDMEDLPSVIYTPQQGQLEGVLPYTKVFQFSVTSPANHPVGVATPITIEPSAIIGNDGKPALPAGVSLATALGYLQITPSTFECTGPNQVFTITVVAVMPRGAVPGQYGYKFTATGWWTDPALGLMNVGAFLNGTVTEAANDIGNPPVVDITDPANGTTYSVTQGAFPLTIPFTFTGGVDAQSPEISGVSASFGPATSMAAVSISTDGVGTRSVSAAGTVTVAGPGTYVLEATATNARGTGVDRHTLIVEEVAPPPGYAVTGTVFFDVNSNGALDAGEFGLGNVGVTLKRTTGQIVDQTTSAPNGGYSFTTVEPGTYVVSASAIPALGSTTGLTKTITVATSAVAGVNFGYMVDFCKLHGQVANGFTIGFWKNNVDKAIAGKKHGVQIPAATIKAYTTSMGSFALTPFQSITLQQASATMGSNSSKPANLLAKQLVASEYNYLNGAYLNGDATATYLFLYWGEYVLANATSYSSDYLLWVKNWFDAYNNTHGGAIVGPALLGTSCVGAPDGRIASGDGGSSDDDSDDCDGRKRGQKRDRDCDDDDREDRDCGNRGGRG